METVWSHIKSHAQTGKLQRADHQNNEKEMDTGSDTRAGRKKQKRMARKKKGDDRSS